MSDALKDEAAISHDKCAPPLSVPRAWQRYCEELSDWVFQWLVIRKDVYGGQKVHPDGMATRWTWYDGLTRERLVRHFAADADASTEDIIGLHVTAPDETGCCFAIDIDRHNDGDDAEANLRFARRIYDRASRAGLAVILLDTSGGTGGYHLWILSDHPIPMADAFRLVHYLGRGRKKFGLSKEPDLFPRSERLTGKRCGHWLRLFGKHHKRRAWAKFWDESARRWLEGEDAVRAILRLRGKPVDVAAIVPAGFTGRPPTPAHPERTRREGNHDGDVGREIWLARDALRFLGPDYYDDRGRWIGVAMAMRDLHDAEAALVAFDDWSSQSFCYDHGATSISGRACGRPPRPAASTAASASDRSTIGPGPRAGPARRSTGCPTRSTSASAAAQSSWWPARARSRPSTKAGTPPSGCPRTGRASAGWPD